MDLLTLAKAVAGRAEAFASSSGTAVTVCVMDAHGNVVLKHRMTGASAVSIELSERKAYTAAVIGMATADLLPLVQPGRELFTMIGVAGGRYCAMGGGAPLSSEGKVIAGVGISGGTVEQDLAVLRAALRDT